MVLPSAARLPVRECVGSAPLMISPGGGHRPPMCRREAGAPRPDPAAEPRQARATAQPVSLSAPGTLPDSAPDREPPRPSSSRGERERATSEILGDRRAAYPQPAYKGTACFNKTNSSKRQPITRPIRSRGGIASRDSVGRERPPADWIEIPAAPIATEETFALAEDLRRASTAWRGRPMEETSKRS
jgi:hypothetical protein